MVLSEEQKKQLVERLKAGREAKKAVQSPQRPAKKAQKKAETPAPSPQRPAPPAAPKPAPVEKEPVIPFEEPLSPPVITDEPPTPKNRVSSPPPSRKDKRLNKQKYMAIKFYEKPDLAIYKKVMRSVQESSSEDEPMELDYEAAPKVKITEAEKARVASEMESKRRDAIYKLLG